MILGLILSGYLKKELSKMMPLILCPYFTPKLSLPKPLLELLILLNLNDITFFFFLLFLFLLSLLSKPQEQPGLNESVSKQRMASLLQFGRISMLIFYSKLKSNYLYVSARQGELTWRLFVLLLATKNFKKYSGFFIYGSILI